VACLRGGWPLGVATRSIATTTIYITIPYDIKEGKCVIEFFSYGIYDLVDYMRADEGTSIM
jgi:hypothetical protein